MCTTDDNSATGSNPDVPFYKFVLTGGPCGGKTTALARLSNFLRERGFHVVTLPEAWTLLHSNGLSYDLFGATPKMPLVIQGAVLSTITSLEDNVEQVLRASGRPSVILCDRGTMDGSVYVSKEDFQQLLDDRDTTKVQLRDHRYDAIFHLVTAANGALHAYTLANNATRTETAEQACQVDLKTQGAWLGHPHLYVLDNATDFDGKLSRLVDVVSKLVGLPSHLKRRSAKFLLKNPPDFSKFGDISYQLFEVEKVYLTDNSTDGSYRFVRRRTSVDTDGKKVGSVYQMTYVHPQGDETIEQKRILNGAREYVASCALRDETRHVVVQKRISFLYDHQSFVIHEYVHPSPGLCILHAQVEAGGEVDLPPFLEVVRELENTPEDEKKYGAYSLSMIHEE